MAKRKMPEEPDLKGKRLQLHPCHLQELCGDKFVRIANQVLRGHLALFRFRDRYVSETPASTAAN